MDDFIVFFSSLENLAVKKSRAMSFLCHLTSLTCSNTDALPTQPTRPSKLIQVAEFQNEIFSEALVKGSDFPSKRSSAIFQAYLQRACVQQKKVFLTQILSGKHWTLNTGIFVFHRS